MSRSPGAPVLRPVVLRFQRAPGALRPQIQDALAPHGEPLRWAITGVRGDELCLEAVVLTSTPAP
ncbi:MAG: hypothetical protein WBN89_16350 [Prochlorococcaceae cyanobacterium]